MAEQPKTQEEYIELVNRQAQQHEDVPSHQELFKSYNEKAQHFQEKECFYTMMLIFLVISFIVVKMFPEYLGLLPAQTSQSTDL